VRLITKIVTVPGVTASGGGIIVRTLVLLVTHTLTVHSGQSRVQYVGNDYVISDVSSRHSYDVSARALTRLYASAASHVTLTGVDKGGRGAQPPPMAGQQRIFLLK